MTAPKSTRGGARPNTGPKTVDGTRGMVKRSVSLDPQTIATVEKVGDGNLSAGIRQLARLAQEAAPA